MKKIIYSLVVSIFAIGSLNAKPVNQITAQQVAENYIRNNTKLSAINLTLFYTEQSSTGDADYFVFDLNNKTGFVIVSAEDAGRPVIGYSTESSFEVPSSTSNPQFNFWMEKRKEEIEYMRANNIQPSAEITKEWTGYSTNKSILPVVNSTAYGPLCLSTWNQNGGGTVPYNAYCPGGSVTGCVATAMAQIMRYWSYPTTGTSSSSYTQSPNTYGYPAQSANYGTTTYNWANMPLGASNADVALLSYQCGVSVDMHYDPSGSGAYVCGSSGPSAQYSYVHYFKYDPSIMCVNQTSYTTANWNALLEGEFAVGRIVQYQGTDPSEGGHTWVCDGNDASDNLHMNWGWGGSANGYYACTNLAPTGQGIVFTTSLGGLIHIQPLAPTTSLDAGLFTISSPTGTTCNTTFTPSVTLRNYGSSTLTSCTINYNVDGQTNQTYSWSGSLAPFQMSPVTLSPVTVTAGSHTFTCFTSSPNGGADGNTSNDQMQTNINILSNVPSTTAPYVEGFENAGFPYSDTYIASGDATQWTRVSSAFNSGTSSMELANFGVTKADVDEFITPAVNFSFITSPTMTFYVSHAQLDAADADQLVVYISTNCGATWAQRYSKSGATLATAGVVSSAFTPSSGQWRQETVNIPTSAIGQSDVRFMFQFTSNGSGNNIFIDDININITNSAVTEEYQNGFNLNVYPNPFNDNSTVSFSILENCKVSSAIYDVVGREIISLSSPKEMGAGTYTLPVNRSMLSSGIYFIKLNVDGYTVTKKIVVE